MPWGIDSRRLRAAGLVLLTVVGLASWPAPAVAEGHRTSGALAVGIPANVPDLNALGWKPVFADEFTTLDETKWHVLEGRGSARDAVSTSATHPGESGSGFLTLKTYTVDHNGSGTAGGYEHFSGGIVGDGNDRLPHGLFSASWGYLEGRIKFENQSGTSSDMWTLGSQGYRPWDETSGSAPETGFEHTNNSSNGACSLTTECNTLPVGILGPDGYDEGYQSSGERVKNPHPGGTPSLQGNFHTYGLLWSPEGWRFYIDGIQVFETSEMITERPAFLLMTQQHSSDGFKGPYPASGTYGDLATSTNRTVVDYIKVWQRPVSEVPDQWLGNDEAISVPFQVADYAYSRPGTEPAAICSVTAACRRPTVQVTADSDNESVVPDANLTVTGNPPTDPDGNFANGDFPTDLAGWTTTGTATWQSKGNGAAGSVRLGTGPGSGGRVRRQITGLQPGTTYVLSHYGDTAVEWTDTNANGRLDWTDTNKDGWYNVSRDGSTWVYHETGEPLLDAEARYEWGVEDVDTARTGAQKVAKTSERNWWTLGRDGFLADNQSFTTGPTTTAVWVYFANDGTIASTGWDSVVHVDDVWVRPERSPNRTVGLRAKEGGFGDATITLTATDGAGNVLGTDQFEVTVGSHSTFTNGGFEALPAGRAWQGFPSAEVVTVDPFRLDRAAQLARTGAGTLLQRVEGLKPNTDYVLDFSGKVKASTVSGNANEVGMVVQGLSSGGTGGSATVTTTGWSTGTINFRTGAAVAPATTTGADVLALDWDTADGPSLVDDVRVYTAALTTQPTIDPPLLANIGEQQLVAATPRAVSFNLPAGVTISAVTSDNQHLLPNRNIGRAGTGVRQVLSLTPEADRTGTANVTVTHTGGTKVIPVVVSHRHLLSPGFEVPHEPWVRTTGATLVTTGQRSGASALSITGAGTATQTLNKQMASPAGAPWTAGMLTYDRTYVVGGWGKAGAKLTVTELRPGDPNAPGGQKVLGTVTWSGTTLNKQQVTIDTGPKLCPACGDSQPQVVLKLEDTTTGDTAVVDDLFLLHGPTMSPIRELALHATQSGASWENESGFRVGRVPIDEAFFGTAIRSVTSSNTAVVPVANVTIEQSPGLPAHWRARVVAGSTTGSSNVTVRLTDPATGAYKEQTFKVTVSAYNAAFPGDRFNNGSFQRGLSGWQNAWLNPIYGVVDLKPNPPVAQLPKDFDSVLMLNQTVVTAKVQLTAGRNYALKGRVFGDGASIHVRAAKFFTTGAGTEYGTAVPVANVTGWQDFTLDFTLPAGVTEAWVSIEDTGYDEAQDGAVNPCITYKAGRSCYDEIYIQDLGPA